MTIYNLHSPTSNKFEFFIPSRAVSLNLVMLGLKRYTFWKMQCVKPTLTFFSHFCANLHDMETCKSWRGSALVAAPKDIALISSLIK